MRVEPDPSQPQVGELRLSEPFDWARAAIWLMGILSGVGFWAGVYLALLRLT